VGFSNVYGVPRWGERDGGAPVVIDGKAIAAELRAEVAAGVSAMVAAGAEAPGLATILVGDDAASQVYVDAKHRACEEAGIRSIDHRPSTETGIDELLELIDALNEDSSVSGILLQLPLPGDLDSARLIDRIDPRKDVDGLSTTSVGALWRARPGLTPCTPSGVVELVERTQFPIAGANAVIVGRSELVGKPLAALLLGADATVTVCHSRTRDLAQVCAGADLLVVACGQPHAIGAEHVKPGAMVIDVGITRGPTGLLGDVDFEAVLPLAGAITPVPGGVGPMTIACLLRNTVNAAKLIRGESPGSG
jgi:methylenetetrahydrofolate dehydrogenase (NADP+)/methenyltetrahydrofolate cyclohydrolase